MQTSNAAFRGPDCLVPRQPLLARLTKIKFCNGSSAKKASFLWSQRPPTVRLEL